MLISFRVMEKRVSTPRTVNLIKPDALWGFSSFMSEFIIRPSSQQLHDDSELQRGRTR